MGRKRNNRNRGEHTQPQHNTHQQPNKRRKNNKKKAPRCWIEECPETDPNEYDNNNNNNEVDVELIISRVLLFDNHSSSRVDLPTVATPQDKKDKDGGDDDGSKTPHTPNPNPDYSSRNTAAPVKELSPTEPVVPVTNVAINNSNGVDVEDSVAAVSATKGSFKETASHKPAATADNHDDDDDKRESNERSKNPQVVQNDPVTTPNTIQQQETMVGYPRTTNIHGATTIASATAASTTTGSENNLFKNARIAVRRQPSARGPVVFPKTGFVHLPNGDCGDGIVNPHPDTVEDRYWAQRHRLFSRFERGIQLDREGWFSVTPEAIANHVAQKITAAAATTTNTATSANGGMIVLDAFVGVGGNAIAFAKRPEVAMVICVDTDKDRLALAANNCRVYEIPTHKVMFVCADAVMVLQAYQNGKRVQQANMALAEASETPETQIQEGTEHDSELAVDEHGYNFVGIDQLPQTLDAIFLSPPWGGSEYSNQRHFDLESIQINESVNGGDLLQLAIHSLPPDKLNVVYFLPRNTNGWRVGQCAHRAGLRTVEMEQNYLNHKLKTITLYTRTH
eukprot:scaffold1314_cov158-Amphora_coffeaeformis.AAC.5